MGKRTAVILLCTVLALEMYSGLCYESTMENAEEKKNLAAGSFKLKAEEAKQKTAEAVWGLKQKGQSWAGWAYDKFSMGFGLKKAGDAASTATETIYSKASDSSKYASDKASEAANVACSKSKEGKDRAYNEAGNVKDHAYDNAAHTVNAGSDQVGNTKDGLGKAGQAFDDAKRKVGETYEWAKDSMTGQAKSSYEASKEKASQATGDVGAQMRSEL